MIRADTDVKTFLEAYFLRQCLLGPSPALLHLHHQEQACQLQEAHLARSRIWQPNVTVTRGRQQQLWLQSLRKGLPAESFALLNLH